MERPSFARTLLRMSSGIIIWALHFGAVYWVVTMTCALGLGEVRLFWFNANAVILGVTALALIAVLAVVVSAVWGSLRDVRNWMTAGVGAMAAVAIVWEGVLPVLMVPACV